MYFFIVVKFSVNINKKTHNNKIVGLKLIEMFW